MRFLDDSGQFGLLITPLSEYRMFRFQLIVGGQLVGDRDGCILGSVMAQLKNRPRINDKRLELLSVDVIKLMELIDADEFLHDSTIMSSVESLDRWAVYSYVQAGRFIIMAQEVSMQESKSAFAANISEIEFESLVDIARNFWLDSQ